MAFIWTPEPTEPLFEGAETATEVTLSIAVAGDPEAIPPSLPKITAYQISGSNSLQLKAQIKQDDTKITLYFADFEGALPILAIDYQLVDTTVIERVYRFEDLPDQKIQVINYQKDPSSPKTLTLEVTATDDAGWSESASYQIIVRADYTPGKNKLLEVLAS
ncbi:hypothetical protein [Thiomicrorhabdus sp.]|uniref:hypothetical protein n=1 Tax=Thiomicrorhabdus sp. TaxID=2039724 RepID=UPI0029C9ACA0|nr:hypothetical protein [Thiomicrorhabdus sp.]